MSKSTVVLLKGNDGAEMAFRALSMLDAGELIASKRVLIKPNLTTLRPASSGMTTDSKVVEGIIKFLKNHNVDEIAIGEGGGCDMAQAYAEFGYTELANKYGVKLIDINKEDCILVKVPEHNFLREFWIARIVFKYDVILNVPKLKIHAAEWKVTLSIKNMMGLLGAGKRAKIHHEDRGVVDLLKIIKPDLTIIDGIVGGEMHEITGQPVEMGIVIGGKDFVATDLVGSLAMGFSVDEIPRHIKLASEMGFGVCDIEKIQLMGNASIEEVKKNFKRAD